MSEVTPVQLIRDGRVTLPSAANVITHKISSMLVVNQEHVAEFVSALAGAHCAVCLVSISRSLIQTGYGNLADRPLDGEFRSGISIDKQYRPNRLVRVLPTTTETKDLKPCVLATG